VRFSSAAERIGASRVRQRLLCVRSEPTHSGNEFACVCVRSESINRTLPSRAAPIECTRSALANKHKHVRSRICSGKNPRAIIHSLGGRSGAFRAFYFTTAVSLSLRRVSRRLFSNAPLDSVCRRVLHKPLRQPWRPSRSRSPLWSRV
jgi:hypothetical protein